MEIYLWCGLVLMVVIVVLLIFGYMEREMLKKDICSFWENKAEVSQQLRKYGDSLRDYSSAITRIETGVGDKDRGSVGYDRAWDDMSNHFPVNSLYDKLSYLRRSQEKLLKHLGLEIIPHFGLGIEEVKKNREGVK